MEKMKCDIVQDLIPSYVDEICSDATRECVEEHIKDCEECRQMVELCKNHVTSGNKIEQRELDGLKKIKRIGQLKGQICCGAALFLLLSFGINVFMAWVIPSGTMHTSIFIVCIILILMSGAGYPQKAEVGGTQIGGKSTGRVGGSGNDTGKWKPEYFLCILPTVIGVYILGLNISVVKVIRDGKSEFWGMELAEVGLFLEKQLIIGFAIFAALFLYDLFRIYKQGKGGNWLLCLHITGCFLALQFMLWMRRMDTIETLMPSMLYMMVLTLLFGILGIAASIVIADYLKRRMN